MRPVPSRLSMAALGFIVATAGVAVAQTAPLPLPPPGQAGAAAPRAAAKGESGPKTRKPKRRDATAPKLDRRRDPALTDSTATQQRRYVPEDFEDDPRAPKPYMSPSGRAGVGMRF